MAISLYDWTKAIFEANLFAKDARILSFTSEGNTKAWKNYAAVSAAKVALEALTRNIALELAPYGIRANCIQAGVTNTASLQMIPDNEKIKDGTRYDALRMVAMAPWNRGRPILEKYLAAGVVMAIGTDTIRAVAVAGPEMQVM